MKLLKFLIGIFLGCLICSVSFASTLILSPSSGNMGSGCLIAVDILADTQGKNIAATDIIMESSLEFVDFVPGNSFPYFFPPKIKSNFVHIVGFAVDPSQRINGKIKLGTAYFKRKNFFDRDGAIRLYFTKSGDTIDSNLSIAGGIDTLEYVAGAQYTFDSYVESAYAGECFHESAHVNGGIKNLSLDTVLKKIDSDFSHKKYLKYLYFGIGILIILVGIFYIAKIKKGKKKA